MEGDLQVVMGRNLRRLRRASGFSQEEFGDHIGYHRTLVGALERGEKNITLRTLERVCQQLGVHPLELLWSEDDAPVALSDGARLERRPPAPAVSASGRSEP